MQEAESKWQCLSIYTCTEENEQVPVVTGNLYGVKAKGSPGGNNHIGVLSMAIGTGANELLIFLF